MCCFSQAESQLSADLTPLILSAVPEIQISSQKWIQEREWLAWLSPWDLSPVQGDLSSSNRSTQAAGDNRMAGAEGTLPPHQP